MMQPFNCIDLANYPPVQISSLAICTLKIIYIRIMDYGTFLLIVAEQVVSHYLVHLSFSNRRFRNNLVQVQNQTKDLGAFFLYKIPTNVQNIPHRYILSIPRFLAFLAFIHSKCNIINRRVPCIVDVACNSSMDLTF